MAARGRQKKAAHAACSNPPFPSKRAGLIEHVCYDPLALARLYADKEAEDSISEGTKHARDSRANSPDEAALRNAIVAARNGNRGPSEHPWKEAETILDKVNDCLESGGFRRIKKGKNNGHYSPVTKYAIYYRLQKFQLLAESG